MIDIFGRIKEVFNRTKTPNDAIYYDAVSGTGGTNYPVNGSIINPSNSLDNAITMASDTGIKKIILLSNVNLNTITGLVLPSGLILEGITAGITVTLGGAVTDGATIRNCTITGTAGAVVAYTIVENCSLGNVIGCFMYCTNCVVTNPIKPDSLLMFDSTCLGLCTGGDAEFDMTNDPFIGLYNIHGRALISNLTADGILIAMGDIYLNFEASCTADGIAGLFGSIMFENTGGVTITGELWGMEAYATALDAGDGSILDNASLAELTRWTADNLSTGAGKTQVKAATVDLHNAAGPQTAATCDVNDVIIDSIVFSPHDDLSDDAGFTGISIETNDTTVQMFISQANGVKVNLTAYSQLSWTGAVRLRDTKLITVTIYGGTATANPSTCDVWITYHSAIDGGILI